MGEGTRVKQLQTNNFSATVAPTTSNDVTQCYDQGSLWLNTTSGNLYSCTSNATGAATWTQINGAASGLSSVPTGNVVWVDAVNGNNATGLVGRIDKPFLTITAALAAASTGQTVLLCPGTYTDATINASSKPGVSIIGIDSMNCVLQPTLTNGVAFFTPGASATYGHFAIKYNATGTVANAYAINLTGTVNATSHFEEITVIDSSTGSGSNAIINDTCTGVASLTGEPTFEDCNITRTTTTNTGAAYSAGTGGTGVTIFKDCVLDGGTAGSPFGLFNGNSAYFLGCRLTGSNAGQVNSPSNVYVDVQTYFAATPNIATGASIQSIGTLLTGNTIWVDQKRGSDTTGLPGNQVLPFKTIQAGINATAIPGTVTLAASVNVVGANTAFTSLAVGQSLSFGPQPAVGYIIASITDDTHLALTAAYNGTTGAGNTCYAGGWTVQVRPGTYNEVLTMRAGTNVIGTDRDLCILSRANSVTETVVTMSDNCFFSNFTMSLTPSANITTAVAFAGTTNATSWCSHILCKGSATGTGTVNGIADSGTGVADIDYWSTLQTCQFDIGDGVGTSTGIAKTGSGTSVYRQLDVCADAGTAISISSGNTYLFGSRYMGNTGISQTSGTPTTWADIATSFSSKNVTSGTVLGDFQFLLPVDTILTPNVLDNTLSQPPTITGTVAVNNASPTVTGTGTSFTTALAVGQTVFFPGSSVGTTPYVISAIASATSLTLASNFAGTNISGTTMAAPRESDAYFVNAGAGIWSGFGTNDLVVFDSTTMTGTVSVTNASGTVNGTGTAFTTQYAVGMFIIFASQPSCAYQIATISSNVLMTLNVVYSGVTNGTTTGTTVSANGWSRLQAQVSSAPAPGSTIIVAAFQGTPGGSFASKAGQLAIYNPERAAWLFSGTPPPGAQYVIDGAGDPLEGSTAVYKASTNAWAISSQTPRFVNLTASNTTTSTTDAVTGMGLQIVPAAGTYEVEFSGAGSNSNIGATSTVTFTPYTTVGGAGGTATPITSAIRQVSASSTTNGINIRAGFCGPGLATVNGVTNIEARWKVGANTGTRYECAIKIRRVA